MNNPMTLPITVDRSRLHPYLSAVEQGELLGNGVSVLLLVQLKEGSLLLGGHCVQKQNRQD